MMIIVDRYIAKNVLSAIALITLMLTGLQIFILFVNQLGDVGRAGYGIKEAAFFVLLQLPYQVYLFFPMASLLGCLVGLGNMASHSELIVMRAAGMSIAQITRAVLKASLLVILIVTVLGETLVPYLSRYSNEYKFTSLSGGQSLHTAQGVWLHYDNDFILIGSILPHAVLHDVSEFRFNKTHELKIARSMSKVTYRDGQWNAEGVSQTEFEKNHTKTQQLQHMIWDISIKPAILKISSVQPDAMNLYELYRYLREQKRTHQAAHQYQLSFLQRSIQPLTTLVMMMLAIPFIFGPLRSSSMGSKLLVGATVGFGFHILNNFLGPVSLVFQWPAMLAAFGPTLLFAVLGVYLMKRVQ